MFVLVVNMASIKKSDATCPASSYNNALFKFMTISSRAIFIDGGSGLTEITLWAVIMGGKVEDGVSIAPLPTNELCIIAPDLY